jgi:hypothetical protein
MVSVKEHFSSESRCVGKWMMKATQERKRPTTRLSAQCNSTETDQNATMGYFEGIQDT